MSIATLSVWQPWSFVLLFSLSGPWNKSLPLCYEAAFTSGATSGAAKLYCLGLGLESHLASQMMILLFFFSVSDSLRLSFHYIAHA